MNIHQQLLQLKLVECCELNMSRSSNKKVKLKTQKNKKQQKIEAIQIPNNNKKQTK